jgi:hypothetical protein
MITGKRYYYKDAIAGKRYHKHVVAVLISRDHNTKVAHCSHNEPLHRYHETSPSDPDELEDPRHHV